MSLSPDGADGGGGGGRSVLLPALTVGLVLADSSVVTLALPAILREFDATVNGVAWVLIAFNLALALFALGGAWLAHRARARRSRRRWGCSCSRAWPAPRRPPWSCSSRRGWRRACAVRSSWRR